MNFLFSNFSFNCFFKTNNSIVKTTAWHITEDKAAPAVPPNKNISLLIGTKLKFNISLIIPPIARAIAGINTFPIPCNAAPTVCSIKINIIHKQLI